MHLINYSFYHFNIQNIHYKNPKEINNNFLIMNQYNDLIIKCPNPEHANNVKLVCFDESCKADRLYCI